jgi:hypothetical protein
MARIAVASSSWLLTSLLSVAAVAAETTVALARRRTIPRRCGRSRRESRSRDVRMRTTRTTSTG